MLKEFKKQYIVPDSNNILAIETSSLGYDFILYTEKLEVRDSGCLRTEKDLDEKDILKEIFGFLNINENKIEKLKNCNKKLDFFPKRNLVENYK